MLTTDDIKRMVGIYAAGFVKQGMRVGLGSGSTIYWLIDELKRRIRDGLSFKGVPTSIETKQLAEKAGIPLIGLEEANELDIAIDGADEIDKKGNVIKGGGGALLQEKIVASAAKELIVIADDTKLTDQLGKFPLPVEVIPFGHQQVISKIMQLTTCRKVTLRMRNGQAFVSDHHHYILDCDYGKIGDANGLNDQLHRITGLVETGLFLNMVKSAVIGHRDGRVEVMEFPK
jgi:ribose 5-phosphate isomerase A